jgi:hypothetical protein
MLFSTCCVVLLHINEFELGRCKFCGNERRTNKLLFVSYLLRYFVVKCGVEYETIIALTKERITTKDIQVTQAHQH